MRIMTNDPTNILDYDLTASVGYAAGGASTLKFDYRTEQSSIVFEFRDDIVCTLVTARCRTSTSGGGPDGGTSNASLDNRLAFPTLETAVLESHAAVPDFVTGATGSQLRYINSSNTSAYGLPLPEM